MPERTEEKKMRTASSRRLVALGTVALLAFAACGDDGATVRKTGTGTGSGTGTGTGTGSGTGIGTGTGTGTGT